MNNYTIEIVAHGPELAIYTFPGFMGAKWEQQAKEIWHFWRANKRFVVLALNCEVGQELASAAVDTFLKPATDREMIDLRRLELVGGNSRGFQK